MLKHYSHIRMEAKRNALESEIKSGGILNSVQTEFTGIGRICAKRDT